MKKLFAIFILLLIITTPFSSAHAGYVHGYFRKNGTYVNGYYRSNPDGNPYNNYSYPGNVNPYTGKTATGNPSTYLYDYYNRSDTSSTSSDSYSLPTYTTPTLPTKNVSYVVKTWVTNNPGVSCDNSTFLRAKERTECNFYVNNINNYTWSITTNEFDGAHYAYDKNTDTTSSCPDGYRILYSTVTGKVSGCLPESN